MQRVFVLQSVVHLRFNWLVMKNTLFVFTSCMEEKNFDAQGAAHLSVII